MRTRAAIGAVLGSVVLGALLGCTPRIVEPRAETVGGAKASVKKGSLVLVTLDTLRADHLGCYGWIRETSPAIDGFARGAIRFSRCVTPISLTTPSHLSMLTGVYPYEHGVLANTLQLQGGQGADPFVPSEGLRSLAQIAREQGYRTGGFVSAAPLKRVTGVSVGFEKWSEPEGARRDGRETIADAMAWLDSIGAVPCFLWVHLFEAHGPYDPPNHPPAEYLAKFPTDDALRAELVKRGVVRADDDPATVENAAALIDVYDASVRLLDDRVSDLLGELRGRGRFDGSTIVLVGDHGQGLGQHGDPGHGRVWWEQLHVPFLLKPAARDVAADATPKSWPGDSTWRGTEVDALVSTIDVLPTAVAGTAGFDARPFLAQARGVDVLADGFESRPVFALAARQKKIAPADALLTERLQFVAGEEGEKLFDLASDERELRDAAAERPEVAARCRALLEKLRAEQQARRERLVRGEAAPIDAEAAARLRKELDALGYGGEGGAR